MIHHAAVDLHRARQRRPGGCGSGDTGVLGRLHEVPAPDNATVEVLVRELASQMERDQRLRAACQRVRERVEPRTWQAFWLTTVEGEPAAEVARRLEIAKGAVPVYKHRVIKMIRSEIGGAAG
jgi:RNA polymerase sigma-70 factor (ECF subfamily)